MKEESTMNRGVEVKLKVDSDIIKDNLSRIGIANRKEKKIFPSCYLVKEGEKYYIAHFKELLNVPGAIDTDITRRNTIIWLFQNWDMVEAINSEEIKDIQKKKLFILNKKQMEEEKWSINHKWHYRTLDDNNNQTKEEGEVE